ncbi:MAG: hypothetical protein R3B99_08245 [Polyangiales bacterium]
MPRFQPFLPMYVDRRAPREGEPAGATDGQVCTLTIISGLTEPGRRWLRAIRGSRRGARSALRRDADRDHDLAPEDPRP